MEKWPSLQDANCMTLLLSFCASANECDPAAARTRSNELYVCIIHQTQQDYFPSSYKSQETVCVGFTTSTHVPR